MKVNMTLCPFCASTYGPKATRYVSDTRLFHVVCSNCGATGPVAASYEKAAAKWNRRQHPEGSRREVAA